MEIIERKRRIVKYKLGRNNFRTFEEGLEKEWLLTNGIGGFAGQSIIGANTRAFSGYLVGALNPPVERKMILAGTHESMYVEGIKYEFAAQGYIGEAKEGQKFLNRFELDVLPSYYYQAEDSTIKKTVAMEHGKNTAVVCYEIEGGSQGGEFHITPLFNYRNSGDSSEKADLRFHTSLNGQNLYLTPEKAMEEGNNVKIRFYTSEGNYYDREQIPTSMATPNYIIEENQYYKIDNRTGFLGLDNHYTPYDVRMAIAPGEHKKVFVKCTIEPEEAGDEIDGFLIAQDYKNRIEGLMDKALCQDPFARKLTWSADSFIVKRNSTGLKTILAGYPWFSDWGRDTMIALQGLTLCTGRFQEAREILESFSLYVKDGMIPNVFPDKNGGEPMYNTIDASLWYFYSVQKYLEYTGKDEDYTFIKDKIYKSLKGIYLAYKTGTNYGIHMEEDGLISGGSDLDQLTWMDVRVGELVVTPRHGKAVEVNALWYNALRVLSDLSEHFGEENKEYMELADKVKVSFSEGFWNEEENCLYDTIKDGEADAKIRPNQIYAVSLPYTMLDADKEKKIVETVYRRLYTPYGLCSLSPTDKEFKPYYIGKLINRDLAYHMGTAWGYLSGAFITAYCKVNHYSKEAVEKAEEMCRYFEDHMEDGCLNGIAEIFDGSFACTSRGCFTQAWSVAEVLRAYTEDVVKHK